MLRRRLFSLMILNSKVWPDQVFDIGNATQRDLRAGQERVHAHQVDRHAALDLAGERARHLLVGLVGFLDLLPDAQEVGLLLGQDDDAFAVLQILQEYFDFIAGLQLIGILELVPRDRAFALEAHVEDDRCISNAQYARLYDLAFFNRRQGLIVHLHERFVLFRRVLVFLEEIETDGLRLLAFLRLATLLRRRDLGIEIVVVVVPTKCH